MLYKLLRKIYGRKNRFLKVHCINCSDQIDLIESVVDWLVWKKILLTPNWLIKRQLAKSGITDASIEASKERCLRIIEEYKTNNQ